MQQDGADDQGNGGVGAEDEGVLNSGKRDGDRFGGVEIRVEGEQAVAGQERKETGDLLGDEDVEQVLNESPQTRSPATAPELWRTIMAIPRPSTADSEVHTRAHSVVAAMADVSPVSMSAIRAPAKPAASPAAPSTRPIAAAVSVLDSAITQRAGCAVRAPASVPCCASELNNKIPPIAASTAVTEVQ